MPNQTPDETKELAATNSYEVSLEFLRAVYDTSPDMIFIYSADGTLIDVNQNTLAQFQYKKRDILRTSSSQLMGMCDQKRSLQADLKKAALSQAATRFEWIARRKNSTEFPVEVRMKPLPKGLTLEGKSADMMVILCDISERKIYEEKILKMAHFDLVTGLINRTLVEDRARQAIRRAKRHKTKMAFLFMDLDHFKQVNDQLGHRIGDRLLRAVGSRVQSVVRENDTLGRLGGDEFLILAEEIHYTDDAMFIADKIIKTVGEAFAIEGHKVQISTSIGISLFPEHGQDLVTLIHSADQAMYRAKELGRNKLAVYNPKLTVSE
jgi:diguanylate cyclase (GGDEF)-like protein/PAS domain S-box-containing protein